jgi:hypothetical protein
MLNREAWPSCAVGPLWRKVNYIFNLTMKQNHLTDENLKEIFDRCNKATIGPWKSFIEGRDHISGSDFIQTPDGDIELIGGTKDDHDFIAHCRTDIPILIEEIMRLRTKKN